MEGVKMEEGGSGHEAWSTMSCVHALFYGGRARSMDELDGVWMEGGRGGRGEGAQMEDGRCK